MSDTPETIAAAHGNAAVLREALNRVGHLANDLRNITERDTEVRADVNEIVDVCRAALAAPARNCDVGTKEEQKERFKAFCEERDCYKCPFYRNSDCPLEWALAPFAKAEGGEE